jgi:hypothetical protein
MGDGTISIPVGSLNDIFKTGNINVNSKFGIDMNKIKKSIREFFRENYENKGTDWAWKARIDSTYEYYNEFSYTITHISREVLKSHNYFELHQIDIKLIEGNNGVDILWTFQAKYGGGLIFPPRNDSNDYHDFEVSQFKDQFNKYQSILFKRLETHLGKI